MDFVKCVRNYRVKLVFLLATALFLYSGHGFGGIPPWNYYPPETVGEPVLLSPIFSDEPLGEFQSITIPLKRAGRLFLIEARIGDQVGNLIFDTCLLYTS